MLRIAFVVIAMYLLKNAPKTAEVTTSRTNFCSWDSTKNWKVYHLTNFRRVVGISVDSLSFLESTNLDKDTLHELLCHAEKIFQGTESIQWQGCYLASYEAGQGQIRKVLVSMYGGFFYLQRDASYFQLPPEARQDWLSFFSGSYMKMEKKVP
jgi:hypothetical protein